MHLTFRTTNEDETVVLGSVLAGVLRAGDVVAIDGELGAGKTRLVRGIAEGLGMGAAAVSSPTYVLVHEYQSPNPLTPPLIHVDAYRLAGPDDLDSVGWDRVADGTGIVVIEWASRIAAALAREPSLARVHIETLGQTERRLSLLAPPGWSERAGWARLAALANAADGSGGPAGARCPVCGRGSGSSGMLAPFCSERCRLVDLGKWLTGRYVVSRELEGDDLDDPDLEPPRAG